MARKPFTITLEVTDADYSAYYIAFTNMAECSEYAVDRRAGVRIKKKFLKAYNDAVKLRRGQA